MTMNEMQNFFTTLMRGIDKKTLVTVEQHQDPNRPGVTVQLSRDKRTGSLHVAEADLIAGQTDAARRNHLRTALKRARDRMWEQTRYIFSTKVAHQKAEGGQWFRSMQGGRGRR